MSGSSDGAISKDQGARDILFRVKTSDTTDNEWYKGGAGAEEWRSRVAVSAPKLEWRPKLKPKMAFGRDFKLLGLEETKNGNEKDGEKEEKEENAPVPSHPTFTVEGWTHRPQALPNWIIARGVGHGETIVINGQQYLVKEDDTKTVTPDNDNVQGKYMYVVHKIRGG